MSQKIGQTELHEKTRRLVDGPLKHIRAAALAAALLPLASVAAVPVAAQTSCPSGGTCVPPPPPAHQPGTGTPGYWKTHASAWPVGSITVGNVTYTKAEAIAWLGRVGSDKTITMFSSLVPAMLNVMLGTFNLLPLPPLDGGAVFSIFLPETVGRRVREFQRNGALSMIGLLVAWRVFPLVSDPIFLTVLRLVHPDASYE